jgi:hypothetical protein
MAVVVENERSASARMTVGAEAPIETAIQYRLEDRTHGDVLTVKQTGPPQKGVV